MLKLLVRKCLQFSLYCFVYINLCIHIADQYGLGAGELKTSEYDQKKHNNRPSCRMQGVKHQ